MNVKSNKTIASIYCSLFFVFSCKITHDNIKMPKKVSSYDNHYSLALTSAEVSKKNEIPLLKLTNQKTTDKISRFIEYQVCIKGSDTCFKSTTDRSEEIYGLSPGRYSLNAKECSNEKCQVVFSKEFEQSQFSNEKYKKINDVLAELRTYSQVSALRLHKLIKGHYESLKKCELTYNKDGEVVSDQLKNYVDRFRSLSHSNSNLFGSRIADDFSSLPFRIKEKSSSLKLSEEKKWKVTMYNFNFEKAKSIFAKNKLTGQWVFDKEGFKQQLLGTKRYGHSAILVGELNQEGVPKDGGSYISWPRGDDYLEDVSRYKNFQTEIIGYIDDTQKAKLDIWLKKTQFNMKDGIRIYDLYDELDDLFEKIKSTLGSDWTEDLIKGLFQKYPETFKDEIFSFLTDEQKKDVSLKKELDLYFGEYEKIKDELKILEVTLDPARRQYLEKERTALIEEMRTLLGFDKSVDIEVFIQKNWEGIEAFENSPNAGHKNAIDLEEQFDIALEKMEEIDQELFRPRSKYGSSYSQNSLNCSHVSGMCANVAIGKERFYRRRIFPADPLDNMLRVKTYRQNLDRSLGKSILISLAAAAALGSVSYVVYENKDDLKKGVKDLYKNAKDAINSRKDPNLKLANSLASTQAMVLGGYTMCITSEAKYYAMRAAPLIEELQVFLDSKTMIKSLFID